MGLVYKIYAYSICKINALPVINYQDNPLRIKAKLLVYLWNHFITTFASNNMLLIGALRGISSSLPSVMGISEDATSEILKT